jgi:hypothetical protein
LTHCSRAFRQAAPAVAFKIPAIQGRETTVALATDNIERSKAGQFAYMENFMQPMANIRQHPEG